MTEYGNGRAWRFLRHVQRTAIKIYSQCHYVCNVSIITCTDYTLAIILLLIVQFSFLFAILQQVSDLVTSTGFLFIIEYSLKLQLSQAAQSRQPCVNSHQLSQWEALGTSHFWPPPTKSTYLNRSLKNCHRWLGPWPLQLSKIWWKSVHVGLRGK